MAPLALAVTPIERALSPTHFAEAMLGLLVPCPSPGIARSIAKHISGGFEHCVHVFTYGQHEVHQEVKPNHQVHHEKQRC